MKRSGVHGGLMLAFGLIACGPGTVGEAQRTAGEMTRVELPQVGASHRAQLEEKSPELMAIQEIPWEAGQGAELRLRAAVQRYRGQWTFLLSFGPRPDQVAGAVPSLALDIENNGGMWGDHGRNLHRLLFEMGAFIRLRRSDGREVEPSLVAFERSYGVGLERQFLLVFPRQFGNQSVNPPFEVVVREFGQGFGTLVFPVRKAHTPWSDRTLLALWRTTARAGRPSA